MVKAGNTPRAIGKTETMEKRKGWLMSEGQALTLRDATRALGVVAELCGSHPDEVPEVNGADWASLFDTFRRAIEGAQDGMGFANEAMVKPERMN